MNRRGFLSAILAAGVAPAFVGSSVLMPVRSLVLPTVEEVVAVSGNTLLTIDMITREALRIFEETGAFMRSMNRQYEASGTVRVRRPVAYGA